MKIKTASFLTMLFVLSAVAIVVQANNTVLVEYFYIPPKCPKCGVPNGEGPDQLIKRIKDEYGSQVTVEWLDVTSDEARARLVNYNLTEPPAIVINRKFRIVGEEITWDKLKSVIDAYLAGSDLPPPNPINPNITVPLIVISGLVDGVNPCAFALLIFFLSFLFGIHRTRGSIFKTGLTYILGLFATYVALGLGLLQTVTFFSLEHLFAQIGIILMITLGLIHIKDSLMPGKFSLKFSKRAIPRAHARATRKFKSMVERSTIPAALVLGGFVGLCEFSCTGGIYIGILVLLIAESTFLKGLTHLVLYNLMFIVPLILILLFASNLKMLTKMDTWREERKKQIKLVSGVFMIMLGLFTWYWIMM